MNVINLLFTILEMDQEGQHELFFRYTDGELAPGELLTEARALFKSESDALLFCATCSMFDWNAQQEAFPSYIDPVYLSMLKSFIRVHIDKWLVGVDIEEIDWQSLLPLL